MSLFVFIPSAVCFVTTDNTIGTGRAEQKEQSNGDESVDDILNEVALAEENLQELYDIINSTLQNTGTGSLSFTDVQAVKSIVVAVISQKKQELDGAREVLDSVESNLDDVAILFAEALKILEDSFTDDNDGDDAWTSSNLAIMSSQYR